MLPPARAARKRGGKRKVKLPSPSSDEQLEPSGKAAIDLDKPTAKLCLVPSHTDIMANGWVARLPAAARPYVLLARLDRPIGAWLLFLPGLGSIVLARAPLAPTLTLILLFAVGSVVMRAAGCVVNDMWDRELDRRVERTRGRPLASGALSMREAALFLGVLLLIGLAILLALNPLARLLGVGSLVLVALYPLAKRFTYWPQAVLGCTFGWGAPLGYAAATGKLDLPALLYYAASILWIIGYDTIYAHQDRADDAIVGVKSTALLFGAHTREFLAICYGASILLVLAAGELAHLAWPFLAALALPAGLLAWQVVALDINDPARCLSLFKANREVGLAIALAFLLGRL